MKTIINIYAVIISSIKQTYAICLKHYKVFLSIIYLVVLVPLSIFLYNAWDKEADHYSDNIIVEIAIGLIFAIIPLIFGFSLGKKLSNDLKYYKFRDLFKALRQKRKEGSLDEGTTRNIVIDIVKNLGQDLTEQKWYEKIDNKLRLSESEKRKCNVCDLTVHVVNKKCDSCKLNIFAWEFDDKINP